MFLNGTARPSSLKGAATLYDPPQEPGEPRKQTPCTGQPQYESTPAWVHVTEA